MALNRWLHAVVDRLRNFGGGGGVKGAIFPTRPKRRRLRLSPVAAMIQTLEDRTLLCGITFPCIAGDYTIDGLTATIDQDGDALTFTNEFGSISSGDFLSETQIIANDWDGGLVGDLHDGWIAWGNGTVWFDTDGTPDSTDYSVNGGVANTLRDGGAIAFTNELGDVSQGYYLSGTQVIASGWESGLVGDLVQDRIEWQNGTVWTILSGGGLGAPVAEDDQAYSAADQTIIVFALTNDSDPNGELLTIVDATPPANGSVTFTDNDVTYTPDPGFLSGSDSFQYTVQDEVGASDTAIVTVTMVDVTDWTLERKDETGTWVAVPDGELSWSHDELRWTPIYSPADPPFAQNIEWLADDRTDGVVNWTSFASASGSQLASGNPDAGEWQITPQIDFAPPDQTSFTALMLAPKAKDVAKIVSVEWVVHQNADGTPSNQAGELVDDPLVTSGKRFFPDAKNPGEGYRPKVDLLVKITPKLAGVTILSTTFDIDDPSDHDGPIDNDPASNVTDVNPADNLSTEGAFFSFNSIWVPTDANGEIRADFWVGWVQPGNNWRIAVAARAAELNPVKPISATSQGELFYDTNGDGFWAVGTEALLDSTSPSFKGVFTSPVLTVWRKLHVEVDSMGNVASTGAESNVVTGNVRALSNSSGGSSIAVLSVNLKTDLADTSANLSSSTPKNGRFENGIVAIGQGSGISTTMQLTGNGDNFVQTEGVSGIVVPFTISKAGLADVGGNVTYFQLSINTDITLTVNSGTLTQQYVGGTISVAGVPMTIATITHFEGLGGSQYEKIQVTAWSDIPFTLMDDDFLLPGEDVPMPDTSWLELALAEAYIQPIITYDNDSVAFNRNRELGEDLSDWDTESHNSNAYWATYLLGAFQGKAIEDNDADSETPTFGEATSDGRGYIYLEPHYDYYPTNSTAAERDTVVHEIGHLVGHVGKEGEPITDWNNNDNNTPTHYLEKVLKPLRLADKPQGNSGAKTAAMENEIDVRDDRGSFAGKETAIGIARFTISDSIRGDRPANVIHFDKDVSRRVLVDVNSGILTRDFAARMRSMAERSMTVSTITVDASDPAEQYVQVTPSRDMLFTLLDVDRLLRREDSTPSKTDFDDDAANAAERERLLPLEEIGPLIAALGEHPAHDKRPAGQ